MPIAEQLVVAVALMRHGEVLAARRSYPPEVAGQWELPGGKVDEGESVADAAVREVEEELGVAISVGELLQASSLVRPGLRLVATWAELVDPAARPVAHEHDELRWLGPEELDEGAWITADRGFLPELRARLLDGEQLAGGATEGAVRIGGTVRRPTGPWTPVVHELLAHLRDTALAPDVLGFDECGREVLTYLPGGTVRPDDEMVSDEAVASCGRALRELHDQMATFRPDGVRRWRYGVRVLRPGEVVCHNDPGLYNWAFDGDRAVGLFDWDMAGPGDPRDDLGFLAWTAIPLYRELAPVRVAHRLVRLAEAYGGVDPHELLLVARRRMRLATERIAAGIGRGDEGMANLQQVGEPRRTVGRLAFLESRLGTITAALDAHTRRRD
ncbi:NUDIX domain-containing protein [Blastococcus sp. Marseille-P5729]|uniref:NUDIX domain-containing protein n=1 Tax=Blastococcus sp. Marseille-P5729 TaxID=2086582 RepID=UPI0018FED39D|nr:NUDIX domain-containing protein [Blastococcus sp. Marseille-P5729]